MNKNKMLNQLIDLIGDIADSAWTEGYNHGKVPLSEMNKLDKKLARHKTKAFAIIDKLIINLKAK